MRKRDFVVSMSILLLGSCPAAAWISSGSGWPPASSPHQEVPLREVLSGEKYEIRSAFFTPVFCFDAGSREVRVRGDSMLLDSGLIVGIHSVLRENDREKRGQYSLTLYYDYQVRLSWEGLESNCFGEITGSYEQPGMMTPEDVLVPHIAPLKARGAQATFSAPRPSAAYNPVDFKMARQAFNGAALVSEAWEAPSGSDNGRLLLVFGGVQEESEVRSRISPQVEDELRDEIIRQGYDFGKIDDDQAFELQRILEDSLRGGIDDRTRELIEDEIRRQIELQ